MPKISSIAFLFLLAVMAGCSSSPPPETAERSTEPTPDTIAATPTSSTDLISDRPDPTVQQQVENAIGELASLGFDPNRQGVWIQTDETLLANYNGTLPLPAASVTKVATTLAALRELGPDHRFVTRIGVVGTIDNGTVNGDLIVEGGEDPFFIWEEAIAIGNLLTELGIERVTGDLLVSGKFYMNYKADAIVAGNFFKQGIDASLWDAEAETQYQTLPPGTPRPQVAIAGEVRPISTPPGDTNWLIAHDSFPVAELLEKMNQYSNNYIADMLANSVGGPNAVVQSVVEATGVPAAEIQLSNGSGLGEENKISARMAAAMWLAIADLLQEYNMTVADVFAVVGEDEGILEARPLPNFLVTKSGSLNSVATISGGLPTQERDIIWFGMMNYGNDTGTLRVQQEALLGRFLSQWGTVSASPAPLKSTASRVGLTSQSQILE